MSNFYTSSMRSLRHLFIAASALTLVACASATPYQQASELGAYDGFTTQMITNDRARVSFAGNSLTERETVENYLIYRAAEVAVENGYENFTLQERDVEQDTQARITEGVGSSFRNNGFGGSGFGNDRYFGYSFFNPRFGWSRNQSFSSFGRSGFGGSRFGDSGFGGGGFGNRGFSRFNNDVDLRVITKYRATAEVKFGRGSNSEEDQTYNAQEVLDNLHDIIQFPDEKS